MILLGKKSAEYNVDQIETIAVLITEVSYFTTDVLCTACRRSVFELGYESWALSTISSTPVKGKRLSTENHHTHYLLPT